MQQGSTMSIPLKQAFHFNVNKVSLEQRWKKNQQKLMHISEEYQTSIFSSDSTVSTGTKSGCNSAFLIDLISAAILQHYKKMCLSVCVSTCFSECVYRSAYVKALLILKFSNWVGYFVKKRHNVLFFFHIILKTI